MNEEKQRKIKELMVRISKDVDELYDSIMDECNLMPDDYKKKSKTDQVKPKEYNWFCSECSKGVTDRVKEYSNDKFGQTFCFDCQKVAKAKIEEAESKEDLL